MSVSDIPTYAGPLLAAVRKQPSVRPSTSSAQRLRSTMAAARVAGCWFGVRKTLTPEQNVIERAEGTFVGYNGHVSLQGKSLDVTPAEVIVSRVHANLQVPRHGHVGFAAGPVMAECQAGGQWLQR